jgi:NAD(P)-dependent dehydrogenase (short-subunit alcohol dehydrogenase family)
MKGKVVLITGGSRGIGKETAILFAQEGADIIINYRSQVEKAREVLNSMAGGNHMMIQADMADPKALKDMVEKVIMKYGRIDVLVNNAGVFIPHPIDEVDYETWQEAWKKTMDINLTGLSNLSFLVAQHMIKQQSGHIINVSSRGAFRGEPDCLSYGASKGGLNSLSQSMAKALGKYNVSVTAVAPGFVETEMAIPILESDKGDFIKKESPFGRVASPVEVAHTIVFLSKEESKFLTGGIVDINGASFLRM